MEDTMKQYILDRGLDPKMFMNSKDDDSYVPIVKLNESLHEITKLLDNLNDEELKQIYYVIGYKIHIKERE